MVRRACALLIAAILPACGGKVVVDGTGAAGAPSTASAGTTGVPGAGGGSASSTMTGGGGSIPLAYNLAEYVDATIWPFLLPISAIDSTGRLFVTDGQTVYALFDGVASIYLSHADLNATFPDPNAYVTVTSLDVGPDDRLYLLSGGYPEKVLVSNGPHNVTVHMTWADTETDQSPRRLAVENPNRVLIITKGCGLYALTPQGTKQIYYNLTVPSNNDDCDSADFVVSQDGDFYYSPGCSFTNLYAGKTDGSGAGILKTVDDFQDFPKWSFAALARHKGGGAVVNFVGKAIYLDPSGKATELSMNPPMTEFKEGVLGVLVFETARIEIGPSGDIYFINSQSIYRATPL